MATSHEIPEPPWLIRLREVDPDMADVFDSNPAAASKLDHLIAGVSSVETKVAIVRSALATGLDPNDPAINLALMVLGVQKLIDADFTDLIERVSRAARAGTDIVESIRDSTEIATGEIRTLITSTNEGIKELIVGGLDDIKTTANETIALVAKLQKDSIDTIGETQTKALESIAVQTRAISSATTKAAKRFDTFSEYLGEFRAEISAAANEAVNTHTRRYAQTIFENDIKTHTTQLVTSLETVSGDVDKIRTVMAPALLAIEKHNAQNGLIIGNLKIPKRVWAAGITGAIIGTVFTFLLFGFAANVSYFGLNADTVGDITAGRFYRMTYAKLSASCQNQLISAAKSPGARTP